jgi:AraC-like DNA-binding protein
MEKSTSAAGRRDFTPQSPSNVSIIRYNSSVATTNSRIELHQNMFSFLLEGSKSIQYTGRKVTINASQFLLLTAGNCLMSEKIAAPGGLYRSILFLFDRDLLSDFFMRHPHALLQQRNTQQQEPFLVFDKDAFLVNFIDSLGLILASGQSFSPELQKVKLEELLVYISGCYPDLLASLQQFNWSAQEDVRIHQAVTANICTGTTVNELAFLCYMSVSTFKRRFAKIYGTSPNKWLLEQRMQKAVIMLVQKGHKASEIYMELGYENLSSFIKSFKQVYGATPKQYQIEHLNV